MPKVRRRGFRRLYTHGLSDRQAELLVYGDVAEALPGDGTDFRNEDEERAAWAMNRAELLKEPLGAGKRPHAYFKWELHEEPRRWWDEIRLLLEHGLIDAQEAADIERAHGMLADDPQCRYYASFENEQCVRRLMTAGPPITILSHADLFEFAERWHRWRGREALAGRYKTRAEVVRRQCEADDDGVR